LTRSVDTHPSPHSSQVALMGRRLPDVISGDVPDRSLGTVSPFSGSNLKAFDPPTPQLSLDKPLSESAWLGASPPSSSVSTQCSKPLPVLELLGATWERHSNKLRTCRHQGSRE